LTYDVMHILKLTNKWFFCVKFANSFRRFKTFPSLQYQTLF